MNMFEQMPFSEKYPVFRKLAEIGDLRKLSREELELYDEDIKNMRDIYATRKFSASFCYFSHFILPTQPLHSPNEIDSSTQRSRIFHPTQSNPSPSAVVSVASMKRINLYNDVHDANEALLIGARTLLKLRPDVSFAASGRNFRCLSWL